VTGRTTSAPTVLFHFADDEGLRARLDPLLRGMDVIWCAAEDDAGLQRALPRIDVWWHVLQPISAQHIEQASRLRLIQKLGTGVDTIDVGAAERRGVLVSNMPGLNAPAVVEMTLALLLAVVRQIVPLHARTLRGEGWPLDPSLAGRVPEVAGSTVGLIGSGDIAGRLTPVLLGLGARVIHTSRTRRDDPNWCDLETLLRTSDIVSVHVPLDRDTRHLIDARAMATMRRGAILINTSRGGVIDQVALADALGSGQLAGAGLDVVEPEPISGADPLLRAPNLVVTPHVAWLSGPTLSRCVALAADNVRRLLAGHEIRNRVV